MPNTLPGCFFLEHFQEDGGVLNQIELKTLPFRIGRDSGSDYIIASRHISKQHAEFFANGDRLNVRDLGSTNGTFVNGASVKESALKNDDIVHLATHEMRVVSGAPATVMQQTCMVSEGRQQNIFYQDLLREILREKTVRSVFQPVVRLSDKSIVGYEALGRVIADNPKISTSELFSVANLCESASDLSRIFRTAAFRDAARIPGEFYFFVNVHPEELAETYFLSLLKENIGQLPKRCRVVLEIHEDTMVDATALLRFQSQVKALGVKIAYDDFGAGQSRLAELVDAPPDFIKIDMKLVRGIDKSPGRQEMIGALHQLAKKRGITMIAEGVETVNEAAVCQRLGCELGQGYLLGRPQSISLFVKSRQTDEVDLGPIFREVARRNA